MPNLAEFHPQVVHFAIALLLVGVAFRFVSLAGKFPWTSHAASALLLLGTVAILGAVRSGDDAHGPVERMPGLLDSVHNHEEAGELARNLFLVVAAIEVLALGLAARADTRRFVRIAHVASALAGVVGGRMLYITAEKGGELVYSFAGGPGIRSGEAIDKQRLLIAGLYHQALQDRADGKPADAARLFDEMARRLPGDNTIEFLRAESLWRDRDDPAAALALARSIAVEPTSQRLVTRQALLLADLHLALGHPDSARAVLAPAAAAFPAATRLKARLDSLP